MQLGTVARLDTGWILAGYRIQAGLPDDKRDL